MAAPRFLRVVVAGVPITPTISPLVRTMGVGAMPVCFRQREQPTVRAALPAMATCHPARSAAPATSARVVREATAARRPQQAQVAQVMMPTARRAADRTVDSAVRGRMTSGSLVIPAPEVPVEPVCSAVAVADLAMTHSQAKLPWAAAAVLAARRCQPPTWLPDRSKRSHPLSTTTFPAAPTQVRSPRTRTTTSVPPSRGIPAHMTLASPRWPTD